MEHVIIHFHLDRGGVTSVVLNHLRAFQQYCADEIEQVFLLHSAKSNLLNVSLLMKPTIGKLSRMIRRAENRFRTGRV
jgi:hypothetical protein